MIGSQPNDNPTPDSGVTDIVIVPANRDEATMATNLHLKNLATGGSLQKTLGDAYEETARALFCKPETLQSVTRTWLAYREGRVVGQVSVVPATEYATRQRASRRILLQASAIARLRVSIDTVRRMLTRTGLGPWEKNQLYIESIAVLEDARRQGVAAALLDYLPGLARQHACDALSLNTLATNPAATGLYLAQGFEIVRRRGPRLRLLRSPA